MAGPWDDDLALAHRLADVAAEVLTAHAGRVRGWAKADGSPVTAADLEADAAIVSELATERPDDAVLSEEGGRSGRRGSRRRWIVDPLDGTSAYLHGGGWWGTLVALEDDGELVLGLASYVGEGRRYWATRGSGAWRARLTRDGWGPATPVQLSDVRTLAEARVTVWQPSASPAAFALRAAAGRWVPPDPAFFPRLLEGRVDVLLSIGGEVWDHAAEVAIVEEAGGRFEDPRGGHRLDLHGGLYTNGRLHEEAAALVAEASGFRRAGGGESRGHGTR